MKRVIILSSLWLLLPNLGSADPVFKQLNQGLRDLDISALTVSSGNPNLAYAGSGRAVYRTENGGRLWQVVFSLKGSNPGVNFLAFNRKDTSIIYAATQNGLFKIKSFAANVWEKLFSGIGESERQCTYVLAEGEEIFLGTKAGLFISRDGGTNWYKPQGALGRMPISCIDKDELQIYVSTGNRLFRSLDSGATLSRVFSLGLREEGVEDDSIDTEEENGLGQEQPGISYLFIDKHSDGRIYLATESGIFMSLDKAVSFEPVYSAGLTNAEVRNILTDADSLYASTQKGMFVLSPDKQVWQNFYTGLLTHDIRFITFDSLYRLWLATDKGVFRSRDSYKAAQPAMGKNADVDKFRDWQLYFKDEPTVLEIQSATVRYAEVIDPQKIRSLRRGARLKALVPDIGLDYDKTINYDSTSDNFYIGPQDWSLGLSWDLGDLIWSDQQRLIDSQVRLMVELRDDILSEVTRLYFERRRLQIDIIISPPDDPNTRLGKELRLEELTAQIDALTGGYLSEQLGIK